MLRGLLQQGAQGLLQKGVTSLSDTQKNGTAITSGNSKASQVFNRSFRDLNAASIRAKYNVPHDTISFKQQTKTQEDVSTEIGRAHV